MALVPMRWPSKPAIVEATGGITISVILPAFNGGPGLLHSIASLHRQSFRPLEIIVVDDGSTDDTLAKAHEVQAAGLIDMIIHHGTRCGRSPAVNAGARFARGDLVLAMDPDTVFEPTALARLAAAFRDPRVAAACCNLGVSNEGASLSTALQGLEYLMSISAGKTFLNIVEATDGYRGPKCLRALHDHDRYAEIVGQSARCRRCEAEFVLPGRIGERA